MKRAGIILGCLFVSPAYSQGAPSAGLLFNAYADHFARYYCSKRFPAMTPAIQRSFSKSQMKFVPVPCVGLKCSDEESTRDMEKLWVDSMQVSNDEAQKMCASYGETLRNIEDQYRDELESLYGAAETL